MVETARVVWVEWLGANWHGEPMDCTTLQNGYALDLLPQKRGIG